MSEQRFFFVSVCVVYCKHFFFTFQFAIMYFLIFVTVFPLFLLKIHSVMSKLYSVTLIEYICTLARHT